ncbi:MULTISPECIES: hypothetical protein, partial [unclassified Burkholderia]|uniref:hypothetical protein n=1 Tax=unclassified Burkholderia TaxID=2613784 RepID=UPI0010F4392F
CLFTTTDQLILMVQRRIADLWRQAAADVPATVNWAAMCVFRTNVTGRFGIVTGDFGNVTGHLGNVTERTGRQDWRCV